MARTALFVSEHGGQSEIVLRVKQGDNPTFGFLMPDNQLHPYFRFLVEHPQLLKADGTQEEKKSVGQGSAAVATDGALSLLGSVYGTGEDDDNAQQQETEEGETGKAIADGNSVLAQKSLKEESASLGDKEIFKLLLPRRNHFVHSVSIGKKREATTSPLDIVSRATSQPGKIDMKLVIVEPPSFLKRTIEKIVEFILRNGKEFEAVLIEQDKTAGRFPFLLPSNQYNSYYLKVLQESVESKSQVKNPSDASKRKSQEASTSDDQFEGWPLDPQRKEKFKMVIGGPKKDSNDQPTKPIRRSGVTADEAAAIVLAATRGRSPFQNTPSTADSDPLRASSTKSLSLPHNGKPSDVAVATAIAKTAALATSGEADSTDASLTKEEKLKAERLKRAKLFAAMIKSGVHPKNQLPNSSGTPNACAEPSSVASIPEEREGSCVPFDVDASAKDRNYRKKQHSRSRDDSEGDSDEDHKHSRKKHRRHHSHGHRHRRKCHDSEDEGRHEKKHRHRHRHHIYHSDSEDEDRRAKRSRHGHLKHNLSEDEDRERSRKNRRKHRSSSEKSDEIEEGEVREKSSSQSDVAVNVKEDHAKPADDATEVPRDLRAKIRAMLSETI